jgi:predicted TIM-barrel fold metal-dependent hydrolase
MQLSRRNYAIAAIVLAAAVFVGLNIAVNAAITTAKIDLTDTSRFTLSKGTRNAVKSLNEPITLNMEKPFDGFPIIDIHTHYGRWPFPMSQWGAEYCATLMKRRGISKAVMSSSYAIVYDFIEGNRQMAEGIKDYPQLNGYVTVNPNYYEASCEELEKYYKLPNFVGAKIHPSYCRQSINSPSTRKLVRKIAEYGRPLLIHTYGAGEPTKILDLAKDNPDLPIIMGHGGADAWREAADVISQTKNIYMEFCCSALEIDKVRRTIDLIGADHILFGSDFDLIHPGFIAGSYEEAGLTQEEKEKILYKNASRIFGFDL